jgi:cytochrome c
LAFCRYHGLLARLACSPGDAPAKVSEALRTFVVLFAALAAAPAFAADGRQLFDEQCVACHPVSGASSRAGPQLKGVVWRRIASLDDFDYSVALKAQVGTWSPDRLDAYLKDSQTFAPGGDMFWGMSEPADRRAIINYLETLK